MELIKNLLLTKNNSSLSLFLLVPILIFISIGCLCSGAGVNQNCITSDGENLVLAGEKLNIIKLLDGSIVASDSNNFSDVMCIQDNEIVTVKTESVKENDDYVTERTAVWRNSSKTHRLARDKFVEKYYGIIQNKYLVSSSRGYFEKTESVGFGNNRSTRRYKVFDQPQVYSLEDFNNGELKSQTITLDKLKITEPGFIFDWLRFYTLKTDETGNLIFAVSNNRDFTFKIYRLNLLTGVLIPIVSEMKNPAETTFANAVLDKGAKYVCLTFDGKTEKGGGRRLIRVLSLENNREIFAKTFEDVSFDGITSLFVENSTKLVVLVQGFKFEPTRKVFDLTTIDLQNGNEISTIDGRELLDKPSVVNLIWGKSDELVVTYTYQGATFWKSNETHLCKINLLNNQIIWNLKL